MKKYFLIITLLMVVFLGLGNNVLGQTDNGGQGTPIDGLTNAGPDIRGSNGTSPSIPSTPSPSTPNIIMDTSGDPITNTSAIVSIPQGTPCAAGSKPVGGVYNAFGICSCPTGQKNVSGVCKPCSDPGVCCGTKLNTSVPFIGKCIEDVKANQGSDETSVTGATAFPTLMGSLTKILVTLILITSFVLIIIGGIMIATGNPSGGRKMIMNVVIGIALLGASGVILRLINPNFFG